ncbi:hypothetical protein Rcae01_03883 [Novipirellula caenicola]|uniref:Uncharacterized protein n=1 Tax=Novipirellula caenicola TaxID=1536901 RepID=A0ABP9VX52_9BACT
MPDRRKRRKELTKKLACKTMASIVVSQGNFFIRTGDVFFCIGNPSR